MDRLLAASQRFRQRRAARWQVQSDRGAGVRPQHARAALQCVVDLLGNDVGLPVEDQRSDHAVMEVRVVDRHGCSLLGEKLHEAIVDRVLHVHALERLAGLAGGIHALFVSYVTAGETFTIVVPLIVFFLPVPAILYGVFYVGYSFWMDRQGGDNTNHNAQLSGAIYGVLFMMLMEPRIAGVFLERLMSPSFG